MFQIMGGSFKDNDVFLEISHCQQRHTWDCGLACIIMILPAAQRHKFSSNFYQICQEEGFGKRFENIFDFMMIILDLMVF